MIKYLSDGRKVSVIGNINKTEYIVQEIFVTEDGSEIPSGENFTTKTLLDSPAKSWLDSQKAAKEERVKNLEEKIRKLEKDINELTISKQRVAEFVKRNNFLMDSLPSFDWEHFADVLCGNVKYCVDEYSPFSVMEYDKKMSICESGYHSGMKFEDIKAISVVKRYVKGTKQWMFNVSRYSDGSGSSTEVKFFKDDEALKEYLINTAWEHHKKGGLTINNVQKIEKWMSVPKEIKDSVVDKHNSNVKSRYKQAVSNANEIMNDLIEDY